MEKALVIGGAGFIGSNVVKELLKTGNYTVKVFDNLSTGQLKNLNGLDYEFNNGNILDSETLNYASKDIDVIFHLAANIGNIKSLNDPIFDSNTNIIGTLNVLSAAKKNNIRKVVYSSSAAIYGELLYQPIDENHPLEPESPYGVSKLAAEKHCLWYGKHYNIDTVCLRYFNVYGINQYSDEYGNVIPKWVDLLLNNAPIKIYGNGSQTRDFVNVRDIAKANVLSASKKQLRGFYNISSGESITIKELALKLKRIFDKEIEIQYEDFRPGEVKHCKADITKAQKILGFKPAVELNQGLKEYVNWIKSQKI
ncbi:UDP-glucose 4-epimerase [Tangfeifania diversioriginum]|uniref:UDP-glucose 4-epimerase n=1 Tax=Tangfeifania diversioriginum TaxID=1168035 RepID=A0A1M6NP71_9BACT|nr:NAD-dependent epimerase/dehydratase family protein [Tangfeifania diversioriginum]SHJ97480.1 UDP-glucose 4-epimerase [Tangfeifania diversioriginum]